MKIRAPASWSAWREDVGDGRNLIGIGNAAESNCSRRGPTHVFRAAGQSVIVFRWCTFKRVLVARRAFSLASKHDRRTCRGLPSSIDHTGEHRFRVAVTTECFVVVVVQCLRPDRSPVGHAAMVVAGLEPLAVRADRRETFRRRIRFERKFNLQG